MFRDSLKKMVDRVEGGVAGILMGWDGIAVESYTRPGQSLDIQTVGMEFSHLCTKIRQAAELLEIGELREVVIKADTLTVIIHALNAEYFMAFAILPGASHGKARYVVRTLVPQLQSEL